MSEWKRMPGAVPVDGTTVWVRRVWFGPSFLADWSALTGEFTTENGLVLPWWVVDAWKAE